MKQNTFTAPERRFLAAAVVGAICIIGLAFWYTVPLGPAPASSGPAEELREFFRVDLNTAGAEELATLPGVGEQKARAIVEYRRAHGRFQSMEEIAQVPGITQQIIDKWPDTAYLS